MGVCFLYGFVSVKQISRYAIKFNISGNEKFENREIAKWVENAAAWAETIK